MLRWAVFQHIGWIGGDEHVLQKALDNLSDISEVVKANKAKVMADLPRIIRLRRQWLADVLGKLGASNALTVKVQYPAALGIETSEGVLQSDEEVSQSRRTELQFELEVLGEIRPGEGDAGQARARTKALRLIRARNIIATLDQTPVAK